MVVKKSERQKLPEELQVLLGLREEELGKDIFADIMVDLLYLATLVDLQNSILCLSMLPKGNLPEGADKFITELQDTADGIVEKWAAYVQTGA